MRVSVIIPTWNGASFIERCISSLHACCALRCEVIVVDNGSTDATVVLSESLADVRVIRNSSNTGFSHAINQGLCVAQGDTLVLLNQDTETPADWLTPLQACLDHDERVGIVGCKLLYPDGSVQHAGGQLAEPLWDGRHITDDHPHNKLDFVTGAAFAIRRRCFEEVGEFDEGFYPAYYEDVDYCLRARALNWRIAYEPAAVLTHYEAQSSRSHLEKILNGHAQRVRLVLKHHPAAWVHAVFVPAEIERINSITAHDWLAGLAHAYFQAACATKEISHWRVGFYGEPFDDESVRGLLNALLALRKKAMDRAFS